MPIFYLVCEQQLAEEFVNRNELQMQLDSKESDIEQLREKLNDLQQRIDNSSITSLQTDETDGNIAGSVVTHFYLSNSTRNWVIVFYRNKMFCWDTRITY